MSDPLRDDAPPAPTSRAEVSVRRRAYRRRAQATSNGSTRPVAVPDETELPDGPDDVDGEGADPVAAEPTDELVEVEPSELERDLEMDDAPLLTPVEPEPEAALEAGPAAAKIAKRAKGRRRRELVPARRVRRTIRRVDPTSLGKLTLVFNLCFLVMVLVAGVILWAVASAAGSIDNIESFVEDIGFKDFQLEGGMLLRGFAIGGAVLAVAGTFFVVLMGVLFNLLSDVVGGIRITMIEPEDQP